MTLLSVRGLTVRFGALVAVAAVDLDVGAGGTVALVGESGSGKTTLARAIAGLVAVQDGAIFLDGQQVVGLAPRAERRHRTAIQMVFQNPDAALNPRRTVAALVEEPLAMAGVGRIERRVRGRDLLDRVGLAQEFAAKQPHQLSGGQRQRVCIARALAAAPRLIIADEAVSALDVSIQGQILNLFADLRRDFALAMLFISHDLSVVRHIADRVLVMYHGRVVEDAAQASLWLSPAHPYTQALIAVAPVADPVVARQRRAMFDASADAPPDGTGCAYRSRCRRRTARCAAEVPKLVALAAGHLVACHHPG
jgi:oligopeptide/dipeptide ABC transporter ATP-binding protein